ncbi:MAG: magnesium transporter [Rhodospirillaceae bacterium]|nr:magnesium transporter [Rhodospirillaceae bacterium]
MSEARTPKQDETDRVLGFYGLSDDLVRQVHDALEDERSDEAVDLVEPLHAADTADLLERLPGIQRDALVESLGPALEAETFIHLDDAVREDIVENIDNAVLATVICELESDDAVDFIECLESSDRQEILDAIPEQERVLLEDSLSYPEDSAGRLMRRESANIPSYWTVGQTIDHMRSDVEMPNDFYLLMVVGPTHEPLGVVPLSRLLRSTRPTDISEIMDTDIRRIPATMDQEDVAFLFRQYGLVSAPVVDESGRLVGAIDVDDIVHVIDEEAEEDLLKLGGVREDDFYEAVIGTIRSRFSWLLVNLMTAVFASIVIGFFDAAIEKVVALAILMPIVASMGGNAGTQTLTVAVRALAVKELTATNALRIVGKETLVGGINGVIFAVLIGGIASLWFDDPTIGGIIGLAMIVNLLLAGLAGTVIPLAPDRWGVDPAVGSTVVLTTVTDVVGFLSFLGLAAMVFL